MTGLNSDLLLSSRHPAHPIPNIMSQSKVPDPDGLFESIKNAIINPDSLGEFIFEGLLAGALFFGIPILVILEIISIFNQ